MRVNSLSFSLAETDSRSGSGASHEWRDMGPQLQRARSQKTRSAAAHVEAADAKAEATAESDAGKKAGGGVGMMKTRKVMRRRLWAVTWPAARRMGK